jgi:hypothetical protein
MRREPRVSTINAFIDRVVEESRHRGDRYAVVRWEPDLRRFDRDFATLTYPADTNEPALVRLYSVSADRFARSARRRTSAVAGWATSSGGTQDGSSVFSWVGTVTIDCDAVPDRWDLAAALRASKRAPVVAARCRHSGF